MINTPLILNVPFLASAFNLCPLCILNCYKYTGRLHNKQEFLKIRNNTTHNDSFKEHPKVSETKFGCIYKML